MEDEEGVEDEEDKEDEEDEIIGDVEKDVDAGNDEDMETWL